MKPADLVMSHSAPLVSCDEQRRQLPGGWVTITDRLVSTVGGATERPPDTDLSTPVGNHAGR